MRRMRALWSMLSVIAERKSPLPTIDNGLDCAAASGPGSGWRVGTAYFFLSPPFSLPPLAGSAAGATGAF